MWMRVDEVKDRFTCNELTEILGTDDIIIVVQQNKSRWHGRVSRKDTYDWVSADYQVEGVKTYRKTKEKTLSEVVENERFSW